MNLQRWEQVWNRQSYEAMDWRHVQMVNAVLLSERPKSVVEIGCADGFSTSAILEAIEAGAVESADLVDIKVRDNLRWVLSQLSEPHRNLCRVFEFSSADYMRSPECWIIDGEHMDQAIEDYEKAVQCARIIILHDTNPEWSPSMQFGSIEAGSRLRMDAEVLFYDSAKRHLEYTHRGLSIGFFYEPKPETLSALKALQ